MMRVFVIAGMSIGVTGTLLGLVLGVLFCCANIENIRQGLQHLAGRHAVRSHDLFPVQDPRRSSISRRSSAWR